MTRLLLLPACLLLTCLALPAAAAAAPASVQVTAREWSLSPSPRGVPAGPVAVRLRNAGQDAHDLALRRVSGGRPAGPTLRISATAPGSARSRTLRLRRGTWRLWCTIPNHRQLGMQSRLRVR